MLCIIVSFVLSKSKRLFQPKYCVYEWGYHLQKQINRTHSIRFKENNKIFYDEKQKQNVEKAKHKERKQQNIWNMERKLKKKKWEYKKREYYTKIFWIVWKENIEFFNFICFSFHFTWNNIYFLSLDCHSR